MFVADSKPASSSAANAQRNDSINPWKQIIEPVEPFLEAVNENLARQVKAFDPALSEYAEYALTGSGKHLRPALVALSAKTLGQPGPEHVTVATIIEMVHLATLVHDDVMDEAQIRRGKLTLASNWGNDIAVLFGDCLFAHSLRLAAEFPTTDVCRAVAAATNTVCSGEILQMRNRSNFQLARTEYFRVIEMKTAELFGLSCEMAAFLSHATPAQRSSMRRFGMVFGTAYQIFDDCLDLFGTEAKVGKSLGTDLVKGKMTLPLLLLRDNATPADRGELQTMLAKWEPGSFPKVTALLKRYDILRPCVATIHEQLKSARLALDELPASAGREALERLADYLELQVAGLAATR
jgi:octaprenyl-diphosphate synthase